MEKLGEPAIGAFALHAWDQPTDGDVGWDGEHRMDMIQGDMTLQDIDPRLLTCFTDDRSHPFCHITTPYFVAILGDPDGMEVDGKGRMGAMVIVTPAPQSTLR
jgi:hypothetical protein